MLRRNLSLTNQIKQLITKPINFRCNTKLFNSSYKNFTTTTSIEPDNEYKKSLDSSEKIKGTSVDDVHEQPPQKIDDNVQELVDSLGQLNLIQVNQLVQALKDQYGFEEMSYVSSGVANTTATTTNEANDKEEEVVEEKRFFNVKLESFEASSKIKVIKEVRAATGLGLKDSKEMVESAPTIIAKDLPKAEAEELIEKIKAVGAQVTME